MNLKAATIVRSIEEYPKSPANTKVVFTNGCFDLLHIGHIETLYASRALGDYLVVGLNSDTSVKRLKGDRRPVNPWEIRARTLAALRYVNCVVKFEEDTPFNLIKALRPDIITKGGDYKLDEMIGKDYVESYGGKVIILPFVKGFSTSDILSDKGNT